MNLSDVTLIDGTRVRSDSEAWRAECEARAVLRMRGRMARNAYLRGVEAKRGTESKTRLYRDAMRLHEHEKKTLDLTRVRLEDTPNATHRAAL